jgi:hypothetical protein
VSLVEGGSGAFRVTVGDEVVLDKKGGDAKFFDQIAANPKVFNQKKPYPTEEGIAKVDQAIKSKVPAAMPEADAESK